jgi:hypothetical protein
MLFIFNGIVSLEYIFAINEETQALPAPLETEITDKKLLMPAVSACCKPFKVLFPNHQLTIIPGAGHFISVEQPKLYIKTIRDFVNK